MTYRVKSSVGTVGARDLRLAAAIRRALGGHVEIETKAERRERRRAQDLREQGRAGR